jgi:hypothetical protein
MRSKRRANSSSSMMDTDEGCLDLPHEVEWEIKPGRRTGINRTVGLGILTDEGKMVSPKSIQDFTGI